MKKIILILLFLPSLCFGDTKQTIDSLNSVLSKDPVDSVRLKTLNELADWVFESDPKKAFEYAKLAEAIALRSGDKKQLMRAWFTIGNCYDNLQMFANALEYYFKVLPYRESKPASRNLCRLYNQIGIIYSRQKNNEEALKYFTKFARTAEKLNDTLMMGNVYNNLGVIYKDLGKRNLASESYFKALKIFSERKFDKGIASAYLNIAVILDIDKKDDDALVYDFKALKIFRSMKNNYGMNTAFVNIGEILAKADKLDLSIAYYDSALTLCASGNDLAHMQFAYEGLYKVYEKRHEYEKAFSNLKLFLMVRDSVFSAESTQLSLAHEASYEMLNKQREIEGLKTQDEIRELDVKKKEAWIIALVLAVVLAIVISFLFFSRSKLKQRQNEILELHNAEIEHRKKEMTDSINYAKRIQMSILPPNNMVEKILPASFVLYKPKDIVSGDFYWVEECEGQRLFAAVDCTGHGVPGAMMSVLGFNLLSQAVNEKKLTKPSAILEFLDFGVDKMLRQSTDENSVRDGMDLSLCSLDLKTGKLQFAGAYNPLWLVKHKKREFVEVKADKMMIGVNAGGQGDQFTNHEIQLEKGDMVYIFSDGYADQFGGPGGKKFKYKPLKSLLEEIHDLPMNEQRHRLDSNIEKWRGDLEQVDDILVIGVRF